MDHSEHVKESMTRGSRGSQGANRFGEKLKALRSGRAMTLQELAAALGHSAHGYISELEAGKKQPSIALVLRVAQLFGVTTDELLRDELEIGDSTGK